MPTDRCQVTTGLNLLSMTQVQVNWFDIFPIASLPALEFVCSYLGCLVLAHMHKFM